LQSACRNGWYARCCARNAAESRRATTAEVADCGDQTDPTTVSESLRSISSPSHIMQGMASL
jgi:hypothetical protein